jgi:hypothetical protein
MVSRQWALATFLLAFDREGEGKPELLIVSWERLAQL